jgi:ribonuclease D
VPPFKVFGAETIRELAERTPLSTSELGGITGFSTRLVERYGQAILAAVAKGVAQKPSDCPHFPSTPRPRRLPVQESRLKRLKAWREEKAKSVGLAPGLLANNVLLESLAERGLEKEQDSESPGLKAWQSKAFGEELKGILAAD